MARGRSRGGPRRKKILQASLTGQEGINLIEEVLLKMGFLWYPTGAIEAGIDGTLEVRDPSTSEATNRIVQVQSRATRTAFPGETDSGFDYLCDERDLDYWLHGNAPVILIRSRTDTREAYWVSIKDYFADPELRKTRKIHFDKSKDRFEPSAAPQLARLAVPRDAGVYLSPFRKKEKLYSNLLRVSKLPTPLYHGLTEVGSREEMYEALNEYTRNPHREWVLRGKTILTIHDLSQHPWNKVVDPGTVETFDTSEWALTEDDDRRRDFVQLLKLSLTSKLRAKGVRFDDSKKIYYFRATRTKEPRLVYYQALKQRTSKEVFGPRTFKSDKAKVAYYRHSAFAGQFVRHEGMWYLEIRPTYLFTWDGEHSDKFGAERLSGIKRLELNASVLGQLLMWAHILTESPGLFSGQSYIAFDELQTFDIDIGIYDDQWLKYEDDDRREEITVDADGQTLLAL